MLTDAQSLTVLSTMWWLWIPPGLMIALAVLSINFIGDGLRDALDPHLMR
jgi:peptide/nickel transport system permease protein